MNEIPKENFPLLLHYHPLVLYRYQISKQADTVLAHFLLEDEQSLETIKNSYRYYEKITTHDSSLYFAVFFVMASKIVEDEKAYGEKIVKNGVRNIILNPKRHNSPPQAGYMAKLNPVFP